jgi:nucleotide-binding universal stress UspA family protein
MIRRILLAYDGSEPAANAFRFSADLARKYGAELHVLAVDLIVLGHRGRGLMDRWRLGSVPHRVISYAACAVTVVR